MNRSIYLSINRFAKDTTFAHGFMSFFALYGGVVLLGLMLIFAWWRARSEFTSNPTRMARVIWGGAGTILAVGIAQPINHLVAEPRPYYTLKSVEVLVPRANDFSFPSDHATVAGAVIVALWMVSKERRLAWAATVIGLFLVFARVYVGAHYPLDVVGGLALGGATVAIFGTVFVPVLVKLDGLLDQVKIFRPLFQTGSTASSASSRSIKS